MTNAYLQEIERRFYENFELGLEIGASLSIWQNGTEKLNLAHGHTNKKKEAAWTTNTLIPVYSATKVPAAVTLLIVLEEFGLNPDSLVSQVWREFPVPDATFAELISHQCGLSYLDQAADIHDYDAVIDAIENQEPAWLSGTQHGYHARTIGFLIDHPVRVLTGKSLGQIWQERIAKPLKLDFWIGLPPEQHHRVATLSPGKAPESTEAEFYQSLTIPNGLQQKTFSSPRGLVGVAEMNKPSSWELGVPSLGGIGTATSLAQFYQHLIQPSDTISSQVQQWLRAPLVNGDDQVLMRPTRFGFGCMFDPIDSATGEKQRHLYGKNHEAFGHPGAGGSHAFADPTTGISFAYTMNQMVNAIMPTDKVLKLIDALPY